MKQTVFFDLGNVLLFFDTYKMYRQMAKVCSLQPETVTEIVLKQVDSYEKGLINTKEVYEIFSHLSLNPIDYDALRFAICDIFNPNQAVIDIARELKAQGTRLFILSNTCEAHFEFALERFDFLNLFDGYVLSYQVGARKPEKKIFEEAVHFAQCDRDQCFYIDDIPEFVSAAKSLKIDAELFTTPEQLRSHLHLRNIL